MKIDYTPRDQLKTSVDPKRQKVAANLERMQERPVTQGKGHVILPSSRNKNIEGTVTENINSQEQMVSNIVTQENEK